MGGSGSLAWESFPVADPKYLVDDTIELPIQINGKVRSRIEVANDATADVIEAAVRADEKVIAAVGSQAIVKVIVVPGRAVNLVIK